ncbi:PilX N-terminal [Desulfocicer vacuolatum DSM 3385]|uniref:PilX N-terminal n=1 Tax=Desulfocicer vacuolatum DSM 3385 TaxID=1121400 RepID=A0A1W1ZGG8_9BACT|nr:pilus assembly PilX N-terminal domain-containing protein [Desulfocicer vacuolatum]SMC47504.1 PilX N-terminal [Desulfocicer vacuolatum DSM 3385]
MNAERQYSLFLNNENGFALLSSMLFLVILTVIGIAATNTSTIETMIAGAEKNKQQAFFAAEAGIEHCTAILMNRMIENFKRTSSSDWTFALSTDEPGVEAGLDSSFIWIKNKSIGQVCSYTVSVRDNNDDGSLITDSDGIINVTSWATAANGSSAGVEVGLSGLLNSGTATGYGAQAGAGAGKSYKSDDVDSITSFTAQTTITP